MDYVMLKDVCKINMGQSPDSNSYNDNKEGIPFFQGNADFGDKCPVTRIWCNAPTRIAHAGDILISVRAPIGALNFAEEDCCIGRGLAAITPNKYEMSTEFVYWFLKGKNVELNCKGTGSIFKAIGRKVLEETLIPAMSLEKQKECAFNLEKIYAIIQLRKKELEEIDNLVKSRFVEMFGDLKKNDKGWEVCSFTDFAKIDTAMIHDFKGYEDYPHIGIDSIEKETGNISGYRTVREDGVISGKYLFTPDHIVYSKIRPNLNKVALPDFKGVCSADAYPILPKKERCNRTFLAYTMRSQIFLDYILAFSNRTNLPKVNKVQVEGFHCPIPDIELQNQFAAFVTQTTKLKFEIQKSLDETQMLMDSLMQEYFG